MACSISPRYAFSIINLPDRRWFSISFYYNGIERIGNQEGPARRRAVVRHKGMEG